MIHTPSLSTAHYWTLPGPRGLVTRIREAARECAAIALMVPKSRIPGLRDRIEEALEGAHVGETFTFDVVEGASLEATIGAKLGRQHATAAQLATLNEGQRRAFVLRPQSAKAEARCRRFLSDFLQALEGPPGVVHLVILLRDGALQTASVEGKVKLIRFEGALDPDEIRAYVAQRMIGRRGPGSTRLLASLVTEYAGYDAHLAEQLMEMADMDILALPETLTTLVSADPLRWAAASSEDTGITVAGRPANHPLREWYLAQHEGPRQAAMQLAAAKRYWRACVHALMPWMEERRLEVLEVLRKPLEALAAANGGKLQRPLYNGTVVDMDIHEVEYNSIVGMARAPVNRLAIPQDNASSLALAVCKSAKSVRDELAHLRRPNVTDILDLVDGMDRLLKSQCQP